MPHVRHIEAVCSKFGPSKHQCPKIADPQAFCGHCEAYWYRLRHVVYFRNGQPLQRVCPGCHPKTVWLDRRARELVMERELRNGKVYFTAWTEFCECCNEPVDLSDLCG